MGSGRFGPVILTGTVKLVNISFLSLGTSKLTAGVEGGGNKDVSLPGWPLLSSAANPKSDDFEGSAIL